MEFTTVSDYTAWAGDGEPVPAQRVIDHANDIVTSLLDGAIYVADDQGRPRYALDALKRAANVQAYALMAAEKDRTGQTPGRLTSATINGASYTYEKSATEPTNPWALDANGVSEWARTILGNIGPNVIRWGEVFLYG